MDFCNAIYFNKSFWLIHLSITMTSVMIKINFIRPYTVRVFFLGRFHRLFYLRIRLFVIFCESIRLISQLNTNVTCIFHDQKVNSRMKIHFLEF